MLYAYVGCAIAALAGLCLVIVGIKDVIEPQRDRRMPLAALADRPRHAAKGFTDTFAVRVLLAITSLLLLSLIWPVLICLLINHVWSARRDAYKKQYPIDKAWLTQRLTIERIESLEMVNDPMGAAPAVAFGFLNRTWRVFVTNVQDRDVVWRFDVPAKSAGIYTTIKQGYVIVRKGRPQLYFVTSYREDYEDL